MEVGISPANPDIAPACPDLPPASPFVVGQEMFGRFILLEHLGDGRCSTAWLADDPRFSREVVLKIFRSANRDREDSEQKLWREMLNRVRGLNHPNIAPAMEFLRENDWIALSNPPSRGKTLAQRTFLAAQKTVLPDWEKTFATLGIAMAHAHEKGRVTHGNLNAFNLLFNKAGEPRIYDFGFRPPVDAAENDPAQSALPWKLACVSPERKRGGAPSQADDLYAFGAMGFQTVTGSNPPLDERGRLDRDAAAAALSRLPAKWSKQILAALSDRPEDRPASFTLFLEGLELPPSLFPKAKDPAPKPSVKLKNPKSSSKKSANRFLAFSIFCLLALGAGLCWLVYQGRASDREMQTKRAEAESIELANRRPKPADDESPAETPNDVAGRPASQKVRPVLSKISSGAQDFLREGRIKMAAGNPKGALESYDFALILESEWPELYEARALAQSASGNLEDAIDEYDNAIKLDPKNAVFRLGRAKIYQALHRKEDAHADFQAALELDPGNVQAAAGLHATE